jgi:cellulose biosynthesis protein BcsQ
MSRCRNERMFLIVDSQPGLGDAALTAVRHADAILVPMNPAPLDWRATVQGLKVYEQQAVHNRCKPTVRLIINRREQAAAIHREVEELARAHPVGCLASTLSKRTAIEKASGIGSVVWRLDREAGARAAAKEMTEAFDEFILALKKDRGKSPKKLAA